MIRVMCDMVIKLNNIINHKHSATPFQAKLQAWRLFHLHCIPPTSRCIHMLSISSQSETCQQRVVKEAAACMQTISKYYM